MLAQSTKKNTNQTVSTTEGFYPHKIRQSQAKSNLPSPINNVNFQSHFQKQYHIFNSNQYQNKSNSQNINSKFFFAQFPHISKAVNQNADTSIIDQLNDNLASLQKLIETNTYEIQKMGDLKQLDRIIQTTIQQLKNLRQNNQLIHDQIRSELFQSVKKIQKDLIQMQKQKKLLRQKCLKQINQSISEAKQEKLKDEKIFSKQIKDCLSLMRQKMCNLSKTLKKIKKQRLISKNTTFQKLESMKRKYVKILKQEQIKRVECDKVIYDLLQSTCNRAQLAIRRSVY